MHFLDPVEDAVNAAVNHLPQGLGELHEGVGALEEVLKGLAYVVESVEYGYVAVPRDGQMRFESYPGEDRQDPDEAKDRVLKLIGDVRLLLDSAGAQLAEASSLSVRLAS